MALAALRSRRLLPTITTLISRQLCPSTLSHPSPLTDVLLIPKASSSVTLFQSRSFKSTTVSFLSSRNFDRNDRDDDKLDPNEILFEGCDYNHWLITMDFPKDPKPSAEEMVETYVQTCAKGLNISVEEAKKKMYACSTTTYQGFQAIMTEAESQQFEGLPGVVFILPDSYIDPVNKEYGGDKYINGTIIPRPPPVQYNRGRNDRNNRPRYDSQRGPPGNFSNQQGPMQGDGRNFSRSQNMPQQNYGPPGLVPPPPPGGGFSQGDRVGNFNQPGQGNYYPQEQRVPGPVPPPPPPGGFPQGGRVDNFNQPGQGNFYPQQQRTPGQVPPPPPGGFPQGGRVSNFNQSGQGNYYQQEQRAPPPGNQGGFAPSDRDNRSFAPSGGFQNFGPGAGEGYSPGARVEQGSGQGFRPSMGENYGPGGYAPGPRGEQGPGVSAGYGPGQASRGEQPPNQGFVPGGNFGPGAGGDGQRD